MNDRQVRRLWWGWLDWHEADVMAVALYTQMLEGNVGHQLMAIDQTRSTLHDHVKDRSKTVMQFSGFTPRELPDKLFNPARSGDR